MLLRGYYFHRTWCLERLYICPTSRDFSSSVNTGWRKLWCMCVSLRCFPLDAAVVYKGCLWLTAALCCRECGGQEQLTSRQPDGTAPPAASLLTLGYLQASYHSSSLSKCGPMWLTRARYCVSICMIVSQAVYILSIHVSALFCIHLSSWQTESQSASQNISACCCCRYTARCDL